MSGHSCRDALERVFEYLDNELAPATPLRSSIISRSAAVVTPSSSIANLSRTRCSVQRIASVARPKD